MASADLLIALRGRVPVTAAQIGRATGADEETVRAWRERRTAPRDTAAQRVVELVPFIERWPGT
jgi:DNA-binding transcriptional regulator YiaG